jgi:uncharacterized membrane protein YqgA involved in biofilm formation
MPIGIIANVLAVIIGGILGGTGGHLLSESYKEKLNMIFGACAMTMGISSIALMENMPAVIFAVIFGTTIGLAVHLEAWVNRGAAAMQKLISRFVSQEHTDLSEADFTSELVTIIVLFCASGTGIYGAIVSGMNGDHSILIAKSIMDLFTAMIFACILGYVVCLIAIPQFLIFILLFLLAGVIFPLTTPTMINDFKATGGVLLVATGFRMLKLKEFPTADMIPAMMLAMPCSAIWTGWVLPLMS